MRASSKTFARKIKCAALAAALAAPSIALANTLENVQNRGELTCGIVGRLPGFSAPDDAGRMSGIDADVCRAVAAAVLGDADRVRFVPLTGKERFTALASGEIDVLSRVTTHTLLRDASLGLNFTYYNFIDGQGFLVKKEMNVKSARELDGARICVQAGTTTELNLADYFRSNNMEFAAVVYDDFLQNREGFDGGACDAMTSDKSQLAAVRSELTDPNSAIILPETISKEPLGPVVRQGDDVWFNTVKWVLYALINAEEYGVTSANAEQMKTASTNPNVKRLLGSEGGMCKLISEALSDSCFLFAVKQVGNYGEMYERNVGTNTPIGIPRENSPNALWTQGGLLYAPPIR